MDAIKVMDELLATGKRLADDSSRQVGSLGIGDHVAQGDVLFWPLDSVPCDAIQDTEPGRQLAEGTTKGSRHCVRQEDMQHCVFYRLGSPNTLQGPIIEMRAPTVVEHPEHGDLCFPPGVYFVTYQRSHSEELKRVAD